MSGNSFRNMPLQTGASRIAAKSEDAAEWQAGEALSP